MSHSKAHLPLAFGVGFWSNDLSELSNQLEIAEVLREKNIKILDTARHYNHGKSEEYLGASGLSSEFEIITKASMVLTPGGATKEGILKDWGLSTAALNTDHIAFLLLHQPEERTLISETMEGIQELYLAGKFDQFGLSNFSKTQVEECYHYANSKGYVLPTVYQSIYSTITRKNEKSLFPTLRRLGISIQAYSTLGSGFLVKTPAEVKSGIGNFNPDTVLGKILYDMYGKESYLNYLTEYSKLCEESGISKAGLATRWVVWNSDLDPTKGDLVVLGAKNAKQLRKTVEEIERGPLEEWVVERLDGLWKSVEKDAPQDNFATFKKLSAAGLL